MGANWGWKLVRGQGVDLGWIFKLVEQLLSVSWVDVETCVGPRGGSGEDLETWVPIVAHQSRKWNLKCSSRLCVLFYP